MKVIGDVDMGCVVWGLQSSPANSRLLGMSLEESLQLQAAEAAREAENRAIVSARAQRKVQEGFARARALAVADYLYVMRIDTSLL